ncbi:DoxX family protein [Dictyobacter aurantiacus]|uniref:DoxX family protein n=1 Tax=Dictyobacter aurantiacus TaxID=1936993 RepID=A0A401ZSS9_9CHLR|nr:DoxX family protein [Dictyobacter aurantiacus]GCE09935.1 hypothetical protein KDAU_72640 [Dictyobacter aurantiacus]
MIQVVNHPQKSASAASSKRRQLLITSMLWIVQLALAFTFLSAGIMKLTTPIEKLNALMPLPLPVLFVHFIGCAEITGAISLTLPALLRIRPGLTPLAACGLIIIMIGATGYTILGQGPLAALMPLIVGLLCLSVAYGRRTTLIADPLFGRIFKQQASH